MKRNAGAAARNAAIWAVAFAIGVVVGPVAIAMFHGEDVSTGLVSAKLLLAAGSFPVVFLVLLGWATVSHREPSASGAFGAGIVGTETVAAGGRGQTRRKPASPQLRGPAIEPRVPARDDSTSAPAAEETKEGEGNERFLRIVAMELSLNRRDEDLWAQASLLAGGDESARQATYIRFRVERLSAFARARLSGRNSREELSPSVLPERVSGTEGSTSNASMGGGASGGGSRVSAHLPEDEELWERALTELEGRNRRAGLWARAFAESGGDAAAAKAAYLRLRVAQLARERAVAGAPGARRASWSGDRVLEPDRR